MGGAMDMDPTGLGFTKWLLVIAVVLIVCGPERIPEFARKAGELLREARAIGEGLLRETGLVDNAQAAGARRVCPQCSAIVPLGHAFCGRCVAGFAGSAPSDRRQCSRCSTQNPGDYSFCRQCGASLVPSIAETAEPSPEPKDQAI